ncbi:MAG: cobalamin biosynthesis protein CbiM [Hyphomicrobiales bacterium]|jgi:cobalt/nickel transport system permease protein|nr:cobalamin biosynthesis protein CbiM [Hyphomicrobiales bacterium]
MAHIPDGVLSMPVLVGGAAAAVGAVALGLKRISDRDIPRVAILASGFFALSLFAVPVGPSSVHLLLGGLMGIVLGSAIFPAVCVALLLQAVMFGFGGLTTLGVNIINIAMPGAVIGALVSPMVARATPARAAVIAGFASAACVACTGLLVALALALSSADYMLSARVMLATYLPLMVVEGLVGGFCISFVKRVKPELLTPLEQAPA